MKGIVGVLAEYQNELSNVKQQLRCMQADLDVALRFENLPFSMCDIFDISSFYSLVAMSLKVASNRTTKPKERKKQAETDASQVCRRVLGFMST